MRQLLAAASGLALCLLAGCTANSVEAAAKLAPLNADAIPVYYPKPGTVITFEVYEGGSSSNTAEAPNRLEEWTWAKVGADLQLAKKSADGNFTTELYDTQSSPCLKAVNGIAVSPCMPVLIDKSQPNPAGGFTGPLDDGLKGSFKAEHEYLGPETMKIKNRDVTCHKVRGKRSFKSKSGEVQIETESWWAEGLGIVKRVESVTSKGLKRVTTLAQSPK